MTLIFVRKTYCSNGLKFEKGKSLSKPRGEWSGCFCRAQSEVRGPANHEELVVSFCGVPEFVLLRPGVVGRGGMSGRRRSAVPEVEPVSHRWCERSWSQNSGAGLEASLVGQRPADCALAASCHSRRFGATCKYHGRRHPRLAALCSYLCCDRYSLSDGVIRLFRDL